MQIFHCMESHTHTHTHTHVLLNTRERDKEQTKDWKWRCLMVVVNYICTTKIMITLEERHWESAVERDRNWVQCCIQCWLLEQQRTSGPVSWGNEFFFLAKNKQREWARNTEKCFGECRNDVWIPKSIRKSKRKWTHTTEELSEKIHAKSK